MQNAFLSLERALQKTQASSRHQITLRHVVVNDEDVLRLDSQMRAIAAMAPAVIAAPNSTIALAARKATASAPIVFGSWDDPVQVGLVESLARPGRNLTGFTYHLPLEQKHLELLKDSFPQIRRVGAIVDRAWSAQPHVERELAEARTRFGLDIEAFAWESEEEMSLALESPAAKSVQGWYVTHSSLPFQKPEFVIDRLERTGKPAIYARTWYVEKGGLMAYQAEFDDFFDVWAKLIGSVIDGVPAAVIPVERARHFELSLNLAAVRRLGAVLPRSILFRADRFY